MSYSVSVEEGTLVGKIVEVCGMQYPYAKLRLQVVAQRELEIVGRPVNDKNIRKLERKTSISMGDYYLVSVSDAV